MAAIYQTIANRAGPLTALRYTERLRSRIDRIALAPDAGRLRNDLKAGVRIAGFERRCAIAYMFGDGEVVILNVFYGGRDYESLFRDPATQD